MKLFAVVVAVVAVAVVLSVLVLGGVKGEGASSSSSPSPSSSSVFVLGGRGGQSALEFGGVVVGFFSGGRGPVSFFRLACPTFDTCQEVCSVREGFCQEGILSGSGLCQEAGSARKGVSFGVVCCLLLGGTV